MITTIELPPLMQQTVDHMKQLGQLPSDFKPCRVDDTDLHLSELLDRETLFRFAYVPFVIAELVWDYADTIRNLTAALRIRETRKLNRAVSELHREYDRCRSRFIDRNHHASEQENMLVFEDGVKSIFGLYITNLCLTDKSATFSRRNCIPWSISSLHMSEISQSHNAFAHSRKHIFKQYQIKSPL